MTTKVKELKEEKSTDDFSSKMLPHGNTLSDADEDSLQEVQFTSMGFTVMNIIKVPPTCAICF